MRLTQQTSYSIRILLYCAANPDSNSRIKDIAATYSISELHLFKIMHVLVESGFVETIRGRNGGIRLARSANTISIGEVVRATESNFYLTDCFDTANRDCPLVDSCGVNRILAEALKASSPCSTATRSPTWPRTGPSCAACSTSTTSRCIRWSPRLLRRSPPELWRHALYC
jgi:Rrf2 family iron-responsive transcriptional regulator